jgi:alpha-amylase
MLNIVFYFQVHQPYRLTHLNLLNLGSERDYFDRKLNEKIIRRVAERCYLPTNALLLKLIQRHGERFKVAFSITGTAIEQLREYAPEVMDSFRALVNTGCVEMIGETYFHSLASLYDTDEFLDQVQMHRDLMKQEFGVTPTVFRNTELIYQDIISSLIYEIEGFRVILTEGADKVLQWRSPLYAYRNYSKEIMLLLKHYKLSDDIAFRFSDAKWKEYPLTAEKYVHWILQHTLAEKQSRNQFLNLFLDYETFGEHQWAETGIFRFLERLPETVLAQPNLGFCHPSEVESLTNYQPESISFPEPVSWADLARDLSAWTENDMQKNALETLYHLIRIVKRAERPDLLRILRQLSTSDHFYYMSTKYFSDGDVHKYFSPYDSPEQAYIYFTNALADIEERLKS